MTGGLRLVRPNDRPSVMYAYHEVGKAPRGVRLAASLRRMLDAATDPDRADALAVDPVDVAAIRAALRARATWRERQTALLSLARWHADWTATSTGRNEHAAMRTYIAPCCSADLWAEIVADLTTANDRDFNCEAREAATANLYYNLALALGGSTGPGAA